MNEERSQELLRAATDHASASGISVEAAAAVLERAARLVSVEDALAVLNRAVAADRNAVHLLINARVQCNAELAADPTIQVGGKTTYGDWVQPDEPADTFWVGILGIINGLFGTRDDGMGYLAAHYDNDGLVEFVRTPGK